MHKVLVPIDGSTTALHALAFAIKRAKESAGTSLHVIVVHPPIEAYGHVEIYPGEKRLRELAGSNDTRILRDAERRLRRTGIAYTTEALEGDPAQVIARRAKSLKCDSIVMGTRGLGRIATLLMGSVATKVVHLTSLPVTLVK